MPIAIDQILDDADRVAGAGRPGVAVLLLNAAAAIEPRSARVAARQARVLLDLGRGADALGPLDAAIAADGAAPLFVWRARVFADLGDPARACDDAVEALARNPADAEAATLLAALLMERGALDRSVAVLDDAIGAGAPGAGLRAALAAGLRALGQHQAAAPAA